MNPTILITGGAGFVGANLTRYLMNHDYTNLHLILKDSQPAWRLQELRNQFTPHYLNLTHATKLNQTIRKIQPDWVFHLAAYGAYSWQDELDHIMNTNFWGTVNLIQACLQIKVKVIINTGSSSEYGAKDHPPTETETLSPNSHYAIAKAAASHYCQHAARTHQLPIPTLRLYSVYGPWEEPTRLIPTLIREGLQGKLPPLVDPNTARDFVYVDDICQAYLTTAKSYSQPSPILKPDDIFNLGTGTQTTLKQLVNLAQQLLPTTQKPAWGSHPLRRWDTTTWVANPTKAQQELGWHATTSLKAGLKKTIQWHQNYSTSPTKNKVSLPLSKVTG